MSALQLVGGTMRVGELGRRTDIRRARLVWNCGHGFILSHRKSAYHRKPITRRGLIVDIVQSVRALGLSNAIPLRPFLRFYEFHRFYAYHKPGRLF